MSAVHIFAPRPEMRRAHRGTCPDCDKPTLFASVFYAWFGWDTTCLRCGRNWQDGEWMPLPFRRTASADSIRAAKAAFRRAA